MAGDAGAEGLIPTTQRFGVALSDIVRCPRCGHRQLAHPPAEGILADAYAEAAAEDYLAEEAGQRETARRVLAVLERRIRPGRLLEIGCWVGFLLDEARSRGWTVQGVEPSRFAARHAREVLGLDVANQDLLSAALPLESYDAVVLGDVLEHLTDPAAALRRLSSLLAPAGVLVLILPDAGSRLARLMGARWWSVIPTHVQYFTRASLRRLLADLGWEVMEVMTSPKVFSVRYYLSRLSGYSPAAGRLLVAAATRAGCAERLWAPDFRDRMLVLARRPGEVPGGR